MSGEQGMSKQGHPREQTQQQGRGTGNRFVRPLALSFDAQMTTGFFESDLQLPALNKPSDDGQWRAITSVDSSPTGA